MGHGKQDRRDGEIERWKERLGPEENEYNMKRRRWQGERNKKEDEKMRGEVIK